ncbi:MAG: GNAT family N-acetyltransferase, partial [Candidatus Paceibacterota bacterium]
DVLRLDWVCDVLDRVFATSEPGFAGVLSALYAGSRLVAAHFGVRSKDTLHLWFPSYDVALDKYSPGLIMFTELFRAAAEAGIQRIDLGKGRERFKLGFMTGSLMLAEGCIDVRPVRRWVSGAWYASRACVRNSPLHGLIQGPKRKLRRAIRWWSEGGSQSPRAPDGERTGP